MAAKQNGTFSDVNLDVDSANRNTRLRRSPADHHGACNLITQELEEGQTYNDDILLKDGTQIQSGFGLKLLFTATTKDLCQSAVAHAKGQI